MSSNFTQKLIVAVITAAMSVVLTYAYVGVGAVSQDTLNTKLQAVSEQRAIDVEALKTELNKIENDLSALNQKVDDMRYYHAPQHQ